MARIFNNNTAASDDSWKAKAFLNIAIKGTDGNPMKLGAIALKSDKPLHAALIKRLQSDPDSIGDLIKNLLLDFRLAETEGGIELPF